MSLTKGLIQSFLTWTKLSNFSLSFLFYPGKAGEKCDEFYEGDGENSKHSISLSICPGEYLHVVFSLKES